MKIAVNTRILQNPKTGIQTFIIETYSRLLQVDKRNEYLFFQTQRSDTLLPLKIINLPNTGFWNLFFDTFLVSILIYKHQPDIFHGPSHILPFFKNRHTKYVLTIHDLSFITVPDVMNKYWSRIYKFLTGMSIRNADLILTDSISTKTDVLKVFHPDPRKVQVVYLGLSNDFLQPKPVDPIHNRPYLLSVATHPLRKNILNSLQAYSKSDKVNNKYDYIIAGPGSDNSVIRSEVSRLNLDSKVKLMGIVSSDELMSLYQHSTAFIYPSLYEGFGLPILEAMSQNTPVIASNISSMPELMPDNSWLVNPHDISDIKAKMEAITKLNNKERKALIEKNLHFVKHFTWDECAKSYLSAFDNVIQ